MGVGVGVGEGCGIWGRGAEYRWGWKSEIDTEFI